MAVPTQERVSTELVFDVLRSALALVLECDAGGITRDSVLADLSADSLVLVEVAEIVEESLAKHAPTPFTIPDAELEAMVTVGDAVDYVTARL